MSNDPYTVNSWDVCAPGMERLRNNYEFILAIPVSHGTDLDDVRQALKLDINSHDQRASFDYPACRAAIDQFCDQTLRPRMDDAKANPFADLETESEDDSEQGCYLYVFMQSPVEIEND